VKFGTLHKFKLFFTFHLLKQMSFRLPSNPNSPYFKNKIYNQKNQLTYTRLQRNFFTFYK
jgi:hypothetical protein